MNEEQRVASQQVDQPKPTNSKTEKDYSKYFERVITAPSLKDAKKRGKEEVKYHKDFAIPERIQRYGRRA